MMVVEWGGMRFSLAVLITVMVHVETTKIRF